MSFDFRKEADFQSRFDQEAEELAKQKERESRQTALIFALLIGVLAGTGIVLLAVSNRQSGPSDLHDCATIESGPARLACFDELSRQQATPFKGAPPEELGGQK
ncbi:hypothetical protein [Hyphomicrobium sp. 2TAF46]|uniref:hypothetical protein n=1 Tax=Hyphomicrobium sp. 2TAF46 TaxID=3233019 RepID=UPI003F92FC95